MGKEGFEKSEHFMIEPLSMFESDFYVVAVYNTFFILFEKNKKDLIYREKFHYQIQDGVLM